MTEYVVGVERPITGYHQDDVGDWVAELECGHNQHVRHRPPFQLRAWVLDPEGRAARLGRPLACPLCERAEMPEFLAVDRGGRSHEHGASPEVRWGTTS